jgi:N-methylhydantoinase B
VLDPAELEVMRQSLTAIPEEMGIVLVRSAYSPNIKERRDASCAVFDHQGRMVAQAEHIPVHLGSMPMAVAELLGSGAPIGRGDAWIVNDPYSGGSHLNDVTVISTVHSPDGDHLGFAVNKAHHSDVGGAAPGSMPAGARVLADEGVVLSLQPLIEGGEPVGEARGTLISASRTPDERAGDLGAQIAANTVGAKQMVGFVSKYGPMKWHAFCNEVIEYSQRRMTAALAKLRPGTYRSEGLIEGPEEPPDGLSGLAVPEMEDLGLAVEVSLSTDGIVFDLSGSSDQVDAPFNAPYSVTLSAVYFALRAVIDPSIPPNHGCYLPVEVLCPTGSLLNPTPPRPVGAGNVETSQALAGVCLAALGQATPEGPVAMSQGTMNNVLVGSSVDHPFTFYETLGGGEGGTPWRSGMSGTHTHMTNTANTPVESLEAEYPIQVLRLTLRKGTGGDGASRGGDGLVKEMRVLNDGAVLTLLTDHRRLGPRGVAGGGDGATGSNVLVRGVKETPLPSKCTLELERNDVVRVMTPGGGGWGVSEDARMEPR